MTRTSIHVVIDENLLDRIDTLVVRGDMSKSEIIRRTLQYGIGEMEQAINRLTNGEFTPPPTSFVKRST